ncbi:fungal-specific transcription factor domain-containing protein [Aspergillus filifer]
MAAVEIGASEESLSPCLPVSMVGASGDPEHRMDNEAGRQQAPAKRVKRGKYVSKACAYCHARKIKCDGNLPCRQCIAKRLDCRRRHVRPEHSLTLPQPGDAGVPQDKLLQRISHLESQLQRLIADNDRHSAIKEAGSLADLAASQGTRNSPQQSHLDTPPDDTAPFVGETSMAHTLREVESRFQEVHTTYQTSISARPSQPSTPSVAYSHRGKEDSGDQPDRICHALRRHGIIPDRHKWDQYLQAFIEEMHCLYPILHLPTLRGNYEKVSNGLFDDGALISSDLDEIAIPQILICLAVGRCTSASRNGPEEVQHSSGWSLYSAAMDLVGGEGGLLTLKENPLASLQTIAFSVIYLLRLDANDRASKVMAILISHAHQLGLHREKVLSQIPVIEREMHRRLWWCIYILDRQVALETGLPFTIQDMNVDTGFPLGRSDNWVSRHRKASGTSDAIQLDIDGELSSHASTSVAYLVCMARYSKVIGKVWEALYKAHRSNKTDSCFDGLTHEYLGHLISSAEQQTPRELVYDPDNSRAGKTVDLKWSQVKQRTLLHMRWTFLRLCIRRPMLKLSYSSSEFTSAIDGIKNELQCMKLAQSIFQQFQAFYDQYSRFEFPFPHYLARTTMISLGLIMKNPSFCQGYGEQTLRMAHLIKSLCRKTWVSGKFARSVVALNRMAEAVLGGVTATTTASDDLHLGKPQPVSATGATEANEDQELAFSNIATSQDPGPQANDSHSISPAPRLPKLPTASSKVQIDENPDILSPTLLDMVAQDFDFERAFGNQDTGLKTHLANISAAPYALACTGSSSIIAPHDNSMPEVHMDHITADAGGQTVDIQPDTQALNMDWVQELLGAGFHPDPFTLW